jgi:cytosine/adenosine deaminase-related metal-dependent hydrolase
MLARGVNVAIGTDSCASSPDLNLLDDLRWVAKLHPDLEPGLLFEMVTTRAARALGMEGRVGCLAPGTAADLCVFRAPEGDDPLREILESRVRPTEVWVDGERVFSG